jgi:hypothetical protein
MWSVSIGNASRNLGGGTARDVRCRIGGERRVRSGRVAGKTEDVG